MKMTAKSTVKKAMPKAAKKAVKKQPRKLSAASPTGYAAELRDVALADVAMLASRIMQGNESLTPARATGEAFELLEWAAAGKRTLEYEASWQIGIEKLEEIKAARKRHEENRIPDDLARDEEGRPKRDEVGKRLPVPFGDALDALMPDRRKVKAVDRLPRFRRVVMSLHNCDSIKAGDIIAEWRDNGVPPNAYQLLCANWNQWWVDAKSESTSKNGEKGAEAKKAKDEAKKGKQGRVRRKTDRRLGAKSGCGEGAMIQAIAKKSA